MSLLFQLNFHNLNNETLKYMTANRNEFPSTKKIHALSFDKQVVRPAYAEVKTIVSNIF